jgi:hypothetical protein
MSEYSHDHDANDEDIYTLDVLLSYFIGEKNQPPLRCLSSYPQATLSRHYLLLLSPTFQNIWRASPAPNMAGDRREVTSMVDTRCGRIVISDLIARLKPKVHTQLMSDGGAWQLMTLTTPMPHRGGRMDT